jgi:hypothetical protein
MYRAPDDLKENASAFCGMFCQYAVSRLTLDKLIPTGHLTYLLG